MFPDCGKLGLQVTVHMPKDHTLSHANQHATRNTVTVHMPKSRVYRVETRNTVTVHMPSNLDSPCV